MPRKLFTGQDRRCLRRTELGSSCGFRWKVRFRATGLVRGPLMCGVCLVSGGLLEKPPECC